MADRGERPAVPWGIAEAALHVISPQRALRRYQAKVTAANLRRSYEAASKSRGSEAWRAGTTSADSEISAAGSTLRARSRELVRNNPLAAQAVQVLVNNLVGYGIRPRAATPSEETNKAIDALWERWAKTCDAHGHTNFEGLLSLAVREMIEGGEVLAIRRRTRRAGPRDVPLRIELYEGDHLDDARMSVRGNGPRIAQGIEYDATGRRRAYWMFPDHPGDNTPGLWKRLESVRVPAEDVAHLFERQRVQNRGVPWGAPAMKALRELGDWQEAELTRKRIEASVAGFVFGDIDDSQRSIAPVVNGPDGQPVEQFEPGMIAYVEGGKDIKFNQPSAHPGIREWNMVQMHIIASGYRVPYAMMTGDYSQFNFSSSRAALNEFRRMITAVQWLTIVPMLCERIWAWWVEAAWTAGLIDLEEVPVEWAPPRFESVNPWQDAQTDKLEVRSGFASLKEKVAERGFNYRDVFEEQAKTNALADQLGLTLDSDPRKTTSSGQGQSESDGDGGSDGGSGGSGSRDNDEN